MGIRKRRNRVGMTRVRAVLRLKRIKIRPVMKMGRDRT